MKRSLLIALAAVSLSFGQGTQINLQSLSKNVNFGAFTHTTPTQIGTTLPSTCNPGELYFKTNATAGANLYGCTAANTWSAESGGGGGGGGVSVFPSSIFSISGSTATFATGQATLKVFGTDGGGNVGLMTLLAGQVPTLNQNTTGNAATATALFSAPTSCGAGVAATGIAANGNAVGCFTPSGGGGLNQLTGDGTAGPGTGSQVLTLANSGVTAGTYTNPTLGIDAKGRVTSATSVVPASGTNTLTFTAIPDQTCNPPDGGATITTTGATLPQYGRVNVSPQFAWAGSKHFYGIVDPANTVTVYVCNEMGGGGTLTVASGSWTASAGAGGGGGGTGLPSGMSFTSPMLQINTATPADTVWIGTPSTLHESANISGIFFNIPGLSGGVPSASNGVLWTDRAENDVWLVNPWGARTIIGASYDGGATVRNDLIFCGNCATGNGQVIVRDDTLILNDDPIPVASLPPASQNPYGIRIVPDGLSPVIGAAVVGGGAVKTIVYSDGTGWYVVAAKGIGGGSGATYTTTSGALIIDNTAHTIDIDTTVVPRITNSITIPAAWTFQQARVALYTVGTLPTCNGGAEGQAEGVSDSVASPVPYAIVAAGGSVHVPVYCDGVHWINH